MRRIAVVTTSRADYGIFRPLLRQLADDADCDLALIVGGMHLAPQYGFTVREIEDDGFTIADRVELLVASDTPSATAQSMALGTIGFANAFRRLQPDIVVLLGDRFEMHSAATAAQPFNLPIAHLHGGELTLGAIDDALRHSITKLSHLHFVATDEYARRVIRMGEEPWRVMVTGALALDNLESIVPLAGDELARRLGISLDPGPILVTFHPTTRDLAHVLSETDALLAALSGQGQPIIFTAPNADTGGGALRHRIDSFVEANQAALLVEHLGTAAYYGLMKIACLMVGNSSSGILEAPSFRLPVVNVGRRQEGRIRAANVIDVAASTEEISAGMARALDPMFRAGLSSLVSPYQGPKPAAPRIARRLMEVPLGTELIIKRFFDGAS
jgi:UDP-hydrolysing UDP-N-acetyl-D-glucosamine 2-epimerase